MPEKKKLQFAPAVCLFGAVAAGAACTNWIPSDWFLSVLGYSILVALILALLATISLKNERRPPVAVAVILEALWLPSRNGVVKFGPMLWAFLGAAGFATGILVSAILLPLMA